MSKFQYETSALRSEEVVIKDGPQKGRYVIFEADGAVARAYQEKSLAGAKLGRKGNVESLAGLAGLDHYLLSKTLMRHVDDHLEKMTIPEVQQLPSRILKDLFNWVKEVSALNEKEETLEEMKDRRDDLNERIEELEKGSKKSDGTTANEDGSE